MTMSSTPGRPAPRPRPQPIGQAGARPAPGAQKPVPKPAPPRSLDPGANRPQSATRPVPPEPISPQPQRDVTARRPSFVAYPMPTTTTEFLPGREIVAVIGMVIGVSTRPRDLAHNPELAYINTTARQDAVGALVRQAAEAGADAVVGVRFDSGKVSDAVTELTAYGTAVRLRPL